MDTDDNDRQCVAPRPNLEEMSISALESYISDLEGEIERARTTIASKREVRNVASALFNQKE